MLPRLNEKNAEAHADMTQFCLFKMNKQMNMPNTQASTIASLDVAFDLRVQVSIKALVNAFLICLCPSEVLCALLHFPHQALQR